MTHRFPKLVCGLAALLMLTACGDRMGDLRQYTNDIKAKKGGRIDPIPQIKPFEVYTYADSDQRSPFTQAAQSSTATSLNNRGGTATAGLHPDFNRNREYLEQFPLDGLKMVGTLTLNGTLFGLVKDSDNVLHRVSVGNYMGQNYGKIISITDSDIKLQEVVPDGQGGWSERVTVVALSD